MINIWDYQDVKRIKLTDIDGQRFEGDIIDIVDAEEESDEGFGEDNITINVKGKYVVFPQSEIKSIEIID